MFVKVLGFDRMDCRACRPEDGVEGSEAHCHGDLADSFRLVGGATRFLASFGVGIRQYTPPKDKLEVLANLIWTRALGLVERCRSRRDVGG